ncbi:4-hydroxyphenylacetate 3-monooxygenase oxygenase component [Geodia barretti]|uniref:4-hydroxyphenylacetate 3-monooxygenase oxygenase component n=1 Tax=Geodia barretti TaxID=519541 RepID=A0AA35X290_GEOBA|nr:4-hydroxyphenylacetate 3-monooxygenase oxygenase component [Geodia barretti]
MEGLKFQCRDTFDAGRSHFDHPASSRFEEMDAIVFFDDVLVPWERVFLYNDVALCNQWGERTNRNAHTGHQVVTKNVIKCEFVLGLASLMVDILGSGELPQTQQLIAEVIENLEITRALLAASEAQASTDEWGIFCPDYRPLLVARKQMIQMYPRMTEILHLLGSSSLMALPAEADLNGPLADEIERYLDTDTATAEERIRLFRLAWDVSCSAFGGRQTLYERYFGGDSARNAALLYQIYDRTPARQLSMGLVSLDEVALDLGGIQHDRRFYLLTTSWDVGAERLTIGFPGGTTLEGHPDLDRPVWTIVWGRRVRGRALMGEWMAALSDFCEQPVALIMSDLPCQVFDEFPVSVLSRASVERLSSRWGCPRTNAWPPIVSAPRSF